MLETSPKIKKWILIILGIIVIVLLVTLGNYWYFQKQISQIQQEIKKNETPPSIIERRGGIEEEIAKRKENCRANFDFNKLDFTAPIWEETKGSEILPEMLPYLIAMEAFGKKDENRCDFFRDKERIHPWLSIENCQRRYHFLKLIDELKKGINCQSFIEECVRRDILKLDVEENKREKTNKIVCETLCQSYQQKTPVILDPENICDAQPSPQADTVDYLDPQTNQFKTCLSGMADEIKFIIAVSKEDAKLCLTIKTPKNSQLCQFYFERDLVKVQNKFKETYCDTLIDRLLLL